MQVKTVSVHVRKAQEIQPGCWYTLELAAEATLTKTESEHWQTHQADLAATLRGNVNLALRSKRPASEQKAIPEFKTSGQAALTVQQSEENADTTVLVGSAA